VSRWSAPAVVLGLTLGAAAWSRWTELLAGAAGVALLVAFAPVSGRALAFRLRPFAFFAVVTILVGGLGPGDTLARLGPLHWGAESVRAAGIAAARLFLIGAAFSWMSLRIGPARIVTAVWAAGGHLKRRGINVDPLLLAFAVAVRFLPLLQDEAVRLRLGWEARGGSLRARGPAGRLTSAVGLVIPLLAAALRRAEDFANAVQVRTCGESLREPTAPGMGASSLSGMEGREGSEEVENKRGAEGAGQTAGAAGVPQGGAARRLIPEESWRALLCVVAAWAGVIAKAWRWMP